MGVSAKICGVRQPEVLDAAVEHGAAGIGLVFFPRSPRNVSAEEAAALSAAAPDDITVVGLFVDPSVTFLEILLQSVRLDLLQLHGSESPERVAEIKRRTGRPVMKAIKVSVLEDLTVAHAYAGVADRLLFDAKTPETGGDFMPGGNALSFDWRILSGRVWPSPWMLSGGLTPKNVTEAVRTSGAPAVDVSSGVEIAPGVKDPAKVAAFLAAVATL